MAKVVVSVLNARIQEVNNLAAKALSTANTALSKARSAIKKILSWCKQWDNQEWNSIEGYAPLTIGGLTFLVNHFKVTADTDENENLTGTITLTSGQQMATMALFEWNITTAEGTLTDTLNAIYKELASIKGATFTFTGTQATISDTGYVSGNEHSHPVSGDTASRVDPGGSVSVSTTYTPAGTITVTWGSTGS